MTKKKSKLKETIFFLERLEGSALRGFTDGRRWGKRLRPLFTFEQAEKLVSIWHDHLWVAGYEDEADEFLFGPCDGDKDAPLPTGGCERFPSIEVEGAKYYSIGTEDWVWREAPSLASATPSKPLPEPESTAARLGTWDTEKLPLEGVAVIDLFSSVGGLTHGLILEGLSVVAGIDVDETCRYAYEENNPGARFILQDVAAAAANPQSIADLFPAGVLKALVGCAPCQPFSRYAKKQQKKDKRKKSDDWKLLESFGTLIEHIKPEIVSMENVIELASHDIFLSFVNSLKKFGYEVSWNFTDCREYGMPTTRVRLVLFASLLGKMEIVPPTHGPEEFVGVWEVIKDLPPIEAGETHPDDPIHCASGLSELNLQRIKATPEGGG